MKKFSMILAAIGVATVAVPGVASAQAWQPIQQRERNLDSRIDQGIRSGALNRAEAQRMRGQLRDLVQLENRYRRTDRGLSGWERRDLNQRFDRLSARVYNQKHDRQRRG